MIARLWHGWTEPPQAETYEELLKHEILPGIEKQAELLLKLQRGKRSTSGKGTSTSWTEAFSPIVRHSSRLSSQSRQYERQHGTGRFPTPRLLHEPLSRTHVLVKETSMIGPHIMSGGN